MTIRMKPIEYTDDEAMPSRLLRIETSSKPDKKYQATFLMKNGKYKGPVHFGAKNYQDYTTIKDNNEAEKKRQLYITRHQKKESNLWKKSPDTPAALSRFILWEKRNLADAISNFRKIFFLK